MPAFAPLRPDLTGAQVDVLAFDAALARGDEASLACAVELYRGPLLAECEWAASPEEPVLLVAINVERRQQFGLRDLLLKINSAATAR